MTGRRARLVERAVSEARVRAEARFVNALVLGGRSDMARRARRMQAAAQRTYLGRPTPQESGEGDRG